MEKTNTNQPTAIKTAKANDESLKVTVIRDNKQLSNVRFFELLSLHKADAYFEDAEKLIGCKFECVIVETEKGEEKEFCMAVDGEIEIADQGPTEFFNFVPNYKIRIIERVK